MSSSDILSSSIPSPIIIFLDATKNHKERELNFIINNLRSRQDIFNDGDTVIVIGILHRILHPLGYQMRVSLDSSSGTNMRVVKDEVSRKVDGYVKMLAKSVEENEDSKEVDITVKVAAGISSKMVVLQESTNYNAAWVILDRFLKKDFQFYLKQLPFRIGITRDDLSVEVLRKTSTSNFNNIVEHVTIFSASKPVPSKIAPDSENIDPLPSDTSSAFEIHVVENINNNNFSEKDDLLISEEDNNHDHKPEHSFKSEICTDITPLEGSASEIVEVTKNDDEELETTHCSRGHMVIESECAEINSFEDNENVEFLECIRSPVASSSSGSRNSEMEEIIPADVAKEFKVLDKDGCELKEVKSAESEAVTILPESITKDPKEELELDMPRLASSLLTFNLANGGILYRNQFKSITEAEKPLLPIMTHHPSRIICGICLEEKNYWQISSIEKCAHTFCYDCVSKYIVTKIEGNLTTIACPGVNCKSFLDINSFRKIVPNDVLLKWDELLCLSLIPESQMVYCPFQDCSALFIKDSEEVVSKIQCLNCKRLFCGQCLVPWHTEFSCKEFKKLYSKEKGKENLLVKELAKKKQWRQCPNCKFYVEKTEGCLHIACRCGYGFCYGCGGKWNSGCKCQKRHSLAFGEFF